MAVLQKNQIYISHFSLDNIYIKDVNINQNSIGSWIYKVDDIDYYIPNYGFVLLIDTTFADVKPTDMPIDIQELAPTVPVITSDLIPIIAAAYKAGTEAKKTNNNKDMVKNIVDAAYNEIINLGNIITPPATTTPHKDLKYYKIYGSRYEDDTSTHICNNNGFIIKKLILNQFKNIMNFNTFNNEKTIPQTILDLISSINANIGNSIELLIPTIFSGYLHNRVGTPLLVSEKEKIPLFSNFNSRKGTLIIWQSRFDEYKWVIYKEQDTINNNYHIIIINNNGDYRKVHSGSLFTYPPSERILPSSTATMKYDETHIFETYNLDNI
jgi:hypothetical protein